MRGAAIVVSLGLFAGACSSLGLETPTDALRGQVLQGSDFGYVIDAAPTGYELCSVGTPSALSLRPEASTSLVVYGDGSLADPYEGSLYGVALFEAGPLAELDLGDTVEVEVAGLPARLGDADGLLLASLPATARRTLTYQDVGGRTIQLTVRGADDTDLVDLASAVVIVDGKAMIADAGLPDGFVSLGDIYQLEAETDFLFTLDYQFRNPSNGGLEDQITLLGAVGNAASMRAFRFRAGFSEIRVVNGSPGVAAEVGRDGQGPQVVSWVVDDQIILRVFSFVVPVDELFAVAESVRRVDGAEWAQLRDTYDPAICPF